MGRHRLKLKIVVFFVIPVVFVFTQNCGRPKGLQDSQLSASSLASISNFQWLYVNVIQPKCVICHFSGASIPDYSSYSSIMASGVVVAGNPAGSLFYTDVQSGLMPKNLPMLSASEISAIYTWILNGALNDSAPGPVGTPLPTPTPVPLTATFSSLWSNVFLPKCYGCHSGTSPSGGVRLENYTDVKNNLGNIYTEVMNNVMPKNGPPLSTDEKTALTNWKNAGAPNN